MFILIITMEGEEEKKIPKATVSANPQIEYKNLHANIVNASTDENLKSIFHQIKTSKSTTVVGYGAPWCRVCSQMYPVFCELSKRFKKLSFVYADIDECPETTQHVRYTPTFHFYRNGEKVDEMFGAGEERLEDRLWLHS